MMMGSAGGQAEGDGQESRWTSQQSGQNSEESKPLTETGLQVPSEAYLSKWNDRRIDLKNLFTLMYHF